MSAPDPDGPPRTYFTSDPHLRHANIIRHARRPFHDVHQMDAAIIANILTTVRPCDGLWILGDLALGHTQEALDLLASTNLPGMVFVPGNHDKMWSAGRETAESRARWTDAYRAAGLRIEPEQTQVELSDERTGRPFLFDVGHLPATGDSREVGRYLDQRPADRRAARPLLHGHVHTRDRVTRSAAGRLQIHVGVDAWDFTPVDGQVLIDLALGRTVDAATA